MRFIIMHKTTPQWEAGAIPGPELVARVGAMIAELSNAKVFVDGAGLRATSQGVRVTFSNKGDRVVTTGPFEGDNELPAGFSIVRAGSIEEAIDWASRQATARGDVEVDIRPVTEPWDIGIGEKPKELTTRRYMALRKATPLTEAGAPLSQARRSEISRLISETTNSGVHLTSVTMAPSRRGRRYKNSRDGVAVIDGPFTESKELIAGYVIISADSLDAVDPWARKYIEAVGAHEVDVRELE